MDERRKTTGPLTTDQRRLVRDNMGLVMVHLRRFVRYFPNPHREREWEDLFQEGCLGLIQAAITFREERGIPFAAFALPRIHHAVSRAIHTKFSTVTVPTPVGRSARRASNSDSRTVERKRPKVHGLSDEAGARLADRVRHHPGGGGAEVETINDRLRGKYERALDHAASVLAQGASTRGDRDELVAILTQERFLVPQEDARMALRQIARQTRSSYARVAQCDKQLGEAVRRQLASDPEFRALRRRARAETRSTDTPIDEDLERTLVHASATEFMELLERAAPTDQAHMIHNLLMMSRHDMHDLVRAGVTCLPPLARESLMRNAQARPRVSAVPPTPK